LNFEYIYYHAIVLNFDHSYSAPQKYLGIWILHDIPDPPVIQVCMCHPRTAIGAVSR